MDLYFFVKTIHIISSTILFGTGIGIAFFMLRSYFSNNIYEQYYAAKTTVLADYLFTFPAAVIQPATGIWLVWKSGYDWMDWWLVITYVIYIIAGACWLPVVCIQIQPKKLIAKSINENTDLPDRYYKLFKVWFILGWPAFIGLITIFFLMVFKPV